MKPGRLLPVALLLLAGCAQRAPQPAQPPGENFDACCDDLSWQSLYDEWHDHIVRQDSLFVSLGLPPSGLDAATAAPLLAHRFRGGPCDSTYTRRMVNGTRRPC